MNTVTQELSEWGWAGFGLTLTGIGLQWAELKGGLVEQGFSCRRFEFDERWVEQGLS